MLGAVSWALAARIGPKLGVDVSAANLSRLGRARRRWRREHLTRGERMVYRLVLFISLLAPAGVPLLAFGGRSTRTAGIVLLAAGVIVAVIPVSPFLRARLRRREADRGPSERRRSRTS